MNNAVVQFLPTAMHTFFESLYISEFADTAHPAEIASIVRVARANNAMAELTGLLMFDGNLFCQQLEGQEETVRHTIAKISVDHRHTQFQSLHEGPLGTKRRFDAWHVGILAPDGPSPLLSLRLLRGTVAMEHLMSVYRQSQQFGLHVI